MIDYKYSEDRILREMKEYIDKTYGQHYSLNKFQTSEFIIDCGHGEGFFIGNMYQIPNAGTLMPCKDIYGHGKKAK